MQCNEIQDNLYDYITGRPSSNLRPVIAEHLMSCSACRAEHDELKITIGLLDQIKPPKVSDGFTERVMQSLEPKVIPFTKRPAYRYIMQGAAAAIVVLAVVSVIKLMPSSEQGTSTVRGGSTTTIISEACKKAIELYNKGASTADWKLKESSLKESLSAGCTDNKVLALIHNNLADCYEQQGRLDEALAGYTRASELDPQLYMAFISLGDIYKKRGQKQTAIAKYQQALSILRAAITKGEEVQKQINELRNEIDKLKK